MNTATQSICTPISALYPELFNHGKYRLAFESWPQTATGQAPEAPGANDITPEVVSVVAYRRRMDLGGEIEDLGPFMHEEKASVTAKPSWFGEAEPMARTSVELGPLVRLAAWIVQPLAASKGIQLHLDVPATDLLGYCDEIQIQRVMESLLTNAIKFSPPGSAITLSARHEAGLIRVWVDDAGPGVRITEQPKLFQRHTHTAAEVMEREGNGALELAACRRIVQAHHGLIMMHNLDPHGAHFEFCLPAMAAKQVAAKVA